MQLLSTLTASGRHALLHLLAGDAGTPMLLEKESIRGLRDGTPVDNASCKRRSPTDCTYHLSSDADPVQAT
ncbi:MAG: hypothetical protein ACLR5S_09985 [Ruminococcus sp.]